METRHVVVSPIDPPPDSGPSPSSPRHQQAAGHPAAQQPAPYYSRDGVTLLLGDCRDVLAALPAESVSCCVTSPPFWGLRKYDCPPSVWGGDPDCPHRLDAEPPMGSRGYVGDKSTLQGSTVSMEAHKGVAGGYAGRKRWQHDGVSRQETPEAWVREPVASARGSGPQNASEKQLSNAGTVALMGKHGIETATCSLCGAFLGWYGLEPIVAAYVDHTIEVLRAIRRVMRKDGIVWWDLDDSRGGGRGPGGSDKQRSNVGACQLPPMKNDKSLCLIPQKIAIAASNDGWIVRSQIIIPSWMPESARDRPTDAYRVVLMLCKSRKYYYDAAAVRVAGSDNTHRQWPIGAETRTNADALDDYKAERGGRCGVFTDGQTYQFEPGGLRNLGNIWQLPPSAYPAAHFATFCLEEPEIAIRASCPAEVCVKCGKARVRITEKENVREHPQREGRKDRNKADFDGQDYAVRESGLGLTWNENTLGWTDCGCAAGWAPGLILDPFIGTGTTAVAARKLGRRCIGVDLSEDYLKQAVTRLTVGDAGVRRIVRAKRDGATQEPLL